MGIISHATGIPCIYNEVNEFLFWEYETKACLVQALLQI
jgi:hypothetical protein